MRKTKLLFVMLILILTLATGILPAWANDTPEEPTAEFELVTYLEQDEISIFSTMGNELPSGATLSAEKISDTEEINLFKNSLGENANKLVGYEITATENNKVIPPKGNLGITFLLPEGYDIEKTLVVFVNNHENYDIVPCRKSGGQSIKIFTDCLGTYLIVETVNPITLPDLHSSYNWGVESVTPAPTQEVAEGNTSSENGFSGWIIAGAVVVILSIVSVFGYFCYCKKKK